MQHKGRFLMGLVGISSAAIAAAGWKFSTLVLHPRRKNLSDSLEDQLLAGYLQPGEYEQMDSRQLVIRSRFGYLLEGQWFEAINAASKKAVILIHGFGRNRISSLKYVQVFLKRGFHVIIYDHTNCGTSGGHMTTMGFREKVDLSEIFHFVRQTLGDQAIIGTHGVSMGAATVLLHAVEESTLAFSIADCPYADLTEQLTYRLAIEYRLPAFPFLRLASVSNWLRAGYVYKDISPIKAIKTNGGLLSIPILFIHGDADTYIPPNATIELHKAKKGISHLLIVPEAGHGNCYRVNPVQYEQAIDQFLQVIGISG